MNRETYNVQSALAAVLVCLLATNSWGQSSRPKVLSKQAAPPPNPLQADPLQVRWMSPQEFMQAIFSRPVMLPRIFSSRLGTYVAVLPKERQSQWSALLTKSKQSTHFKMAELQPLLTGEDPKLGWAYELLASNSDPVVRAMGLIPQIMVLKSKPAASQLVTLARSKELAANDAWCLRNLFHGIGIEPEREDANEVFRFLSTMREGEQRRPAIGTPAPDFAMRTFDGKTVRLSDFRGRVVLLHFWSTTCGPCISELKQLQQDLRSWKAADKDFVAIAVSLDDNVKATKKFLATYQLDWLNVCDGRGWGTPAAKRFYVSMIPTDVVIDRKGQVLGYSRTLLQTTSTTPQPHIPQPR